MSCNKGHADGIDIVLNRLGPFYAPRAGKKMLLQFHELVLAHHAEIMPFEIVLRDMFGHITQKVCRGGLLFSKITYS